MQSENLIVLFDLNSYYWAKFHYSNKKKMEECRQNKQPFDCLSFEDIVECMNYMITCHIAKNNQNKVIIYVFDENQTKRVFPVDEFDEAYMKMLNFVEVRKRIQKAIVDELVNKPLSFNPHSQIIKGLAKSICSSFGLTSSKQTQTENSKNGQN